MNEKQKRSMWVGILIIVVTGLYPPWKENASGNPGSYGLICAPPVVVGREVTLGIDLTRLLIEWSLVGFITAGLIVSAQPASPKQLDSAQAGANEPPALDAPPLKREPASVRQAKSIEFPSGSSIGELLVESDDDPDYWEGLGEARGLINLPPGRKIQLETYKAKIVDLSILKEIDADAIQSIDFSESLIANSDLANIAHLMELSDLDLTDTQVGDEGIQHLAKLQSLKKLWLDRTKITDHSLQMLKQLPEIKMLSLVATEVTESAVKQAKKEFPNDCEIILANGNKA